MNKEHKHDLSVRGLPGTVSLKKLLKDPGFKRAPGPFTVLVGELAIRNNAKDAVQEISPQDRAKQALYFIKTFPKLHPPYLTKWLQEAYDTKNIDFIHGIIDNAKSNREAQQLIGLIQLVLGALRLSKRHNAGCRLYLIEPETHLHPKRQARIMYVLNNIYDEENGEYKQETTAD